MSTTIAPPAETQRKSFVERHREYERITAPLRQLTDKERQSVCSFWLGRLGATAAGTGPDSRFAREVLDDALDFLSELRGGKETAR